MEGPARSRGLSWSKNLLDCFRISLVVAFVFMGSLYALKLYRKMGDYARRRSSLMRTT